MDSKISFDILLERFFSIVIIYGRTRNEVITILFELSKSVIQT